MRFVRTFKLSDWCLKVIVENLNLLIRHKNVPQRHIDFLHRRYSEDIFHDYCSVNTISEETMIWFLNPHNKKITLSIITDKVLQQLQVVGTNLTSLNLRLSLATENILNSIICCVPNLKYLDLSATSCSNKTLFLLQRMCPELLTLNLNECEDVSNEGMINLCDRGNLSLKYLNIIDTDIEYDGLRYVLSGMPSLECLKYNNLGDALCFAHNCEYIADTYSSMQYNLTELAYEGAELCGNPIKVMLMLTVMCPKVKKIKFLCQITEEIVSMCTRFQHLEEIRIKITFDIMYTTRDVITPVLPIANNLKTLILSDVKIPVITFIENLINLKYLSLNNVQYTDFKKEDVKITENKLDILIIKNNTFELPSTACKAIELLLFLSKNVTRLHLNCTNANISQDMFFIILNSMKKLIFVDFSYCNIKISSIKHFFKIPTMRLIYLDLCHCIFSFNKHSFLRNILLYDSTSSLSWRTMTNNPDDSDSDVFSDG